MQPLKLDENFLKDLGLENLPEEQKKAFLQHVLETLELRVGTKLSEGLSDAQMQEFEKLTPAPDDDKDTAQLKQAQALQWLEENRPGYKDTVAQELENLKNEIKNNADDIIGQTSGGAQAA